MDAQKQTETNVLTRKQAAALPHFIAPKSIEAGCGAAKISKTTFYEWLQNETFKRELGALRNQTIDDAVACLKAGIGGAVVKVLKLLDSRNEAIQLRAAQTIIDYFLKVISAEQIEARLAELEQYMHERMQAHDNRH